MQKTDQPEITEKSSSLLPLLEKRRKKRMNQYICRSVVCSLCGFASKASSVASVLFCFPSKAPGVASVLCGFASQVPSVASVLCDL